MKQLSNRTVSSRLVGRMVEHVKELGLTWDEITKRTGIYPEEIADSSRRVEAHKHYKLVMLLKESGNTLDWFVENNDFKIELFINRQNIIDTIVQDCPILILLTLNAPNLRKSMELYIKYRGLVGNVDKFSLQANENSLSFTFFHEYPEHTCQFVPMINFSFLIAIAEHYLDAEDARRVRYTVKTKSEKLNSMALVYAHWGCYVEWEQDVDSIVIENCNIDRPFPQFNPYVYDILSKKIEEEYQAIFSVTSISHLVEDTILEIIHNQSIGFKSSLVLERICSRMCISKTTLSRRLKEENTTYKEIEKRVKLEESVNLLKNTSMSIGNISYHLGFSCQAAFNRFFNDQMDISPYKFRTN